MMRTAICSAFEFCIYDVVSKYILSYHGLSFPFNPVKGCSAWKHENCDGVEKSHISSY